MMKAPDIMNIIHETLEPILEETVQVEQIDATTFTVHTEDVQHMYTVQLKEDDTTYYLEAYESNNEQDKETIYHEYK